MSYVLEPPPVRLRIWQQNLNKSDKAHYDLINSPVHKDWDLLLLKEPYIDSFGNTKAMSRWHTIYPSMHLSNDAVTRSVILVNAALDTNAWAQISLEGSDDITIIQFCLPRGRLTIFNIYNNCLHSNTLELISSFMARRSTAIVASEEDHMVWCGDFNRHHPLWDEERNKHLFMASASAATQTLITLLEDNNMVMLLPKGTPTPQSMATKNWTRVDNVFATANTESAVVICNTDPRLRGPGTDHVPVLTTLSFSILSKTEEWQWNFRDVDWGDFREELAKQLCLIPGPCPLLTNTQFQRAVSDLTQAIQATIELKVPVPWPSPHARRWWSKELSQLKKAMNRLGSQSYKYRAVTDHPVHKAYRVTRGRYGDEIKYAKKEHWRTFLEGIKGKELWAAHQYMASPVGDGGKARIPTLKVVGSDGATEGVATNEGKSAALCRIFFPEKPAVSLVPSEPDYPDQVDYTFRLSMAQLRRCIARLRPHKALGEDGIPNAVLKEVLELIAEYLLHIYRAVFTLNTYSDKWQIWDTIVLRKPSKPRYDVPKAYRPIALMNTMGKVLSALVAEDLNYMCERYSLLPDNHYGGRPGRCTTDAMHFLVHKIKAAWRWHKVMAILFLDVEGAFPNAVTACLLHNMRMRRVPERYVQFMEQLLTDRQTRLKFDSFTSEWMDIDNGIVQGDPLSMILYLFYNADLLSDTNKGEAKVAYVDDANFYAEGSDFEEAYGRLGDMMMRTGGGQAWSEEHNSRFEMSKLMLVGFSRRQAPDPQRPGKTMPEIRLALMIGNTTIRPAASHKFLGVLRTPLAGA